VKILKQNIEMLHVASSSQIVTSDIFNYFNRDMGAPPVQGASKLDDRTHGRDARVTADIAFLDPPYRLLVDEPEKFRSLSEHLTNHLNDDAIVVFRHGARDQLELPELASYDQRTYGGMTLEFLRRSHV
jgi:16S rRNA G966 N2-methylase RsmD